MNKQMTGKHNKSFIISL